MDADRNKVEDVLHLDDTHDAEWIGNMSAAITARVSKITPHTPSEQAAFAAVRDAGESAKVHSARLAGEKRKLEIAESEVIAKQAEMDKKRRKLSVARATAKKSKTYEQLEAWKVKSPLEHGSHRDTNSFRRDR